MLARRLLIRQQSLVLQYRHASTIAVRHKADDKILREAFDRPHTSWSKGLTAAFQRQTGLLKNQYLTSPDGFPRFATDSLHRAQFLAAHVSAHHQDMSSAAVIAAFDRLSDTLCSVLDLSEFVRNSHPDARYVQAAEQAYGILHGFMNTLNTHTGLFAALQHIVNNEARYCALDEEQKSVLQVLLADFYRSGVHLDDASRAAFVQLSTEIADAERRAFTDYAPAQSVIRMSTSQARGLWPNPDQSMLTRDGKEILVPTSGRSADNAMQILDSSTSRKILSEAMQTHTEAQLDNMNQLFRARGKLANVVGQSSHGSSVLANQMAKSPEQVEAFLLNLGASVRLKASAEIDILKSMKQQHLRSSELIQLHSWDEDYYSARHIQGLERSLYTSADLTPFLSVGTVIQGLSRLFDRLYGVHFAIRDLEAGEAWHFEVRCLDVISEDHGHIGALYCDLFSRAGKDSGMAAHFTVRCGRRLDKDELLPGEQDIENGMLTGNINGKEYQLPVIALQCDFAPARGNSFASLSFHEVSTLFHEMGHAIHSMLGTTAYQTISGTRVAADLVELPSQIMESFAESPAVWPLFARHYATDEPAPVHLLQNVLRHQGYLPGLTAHRQFTRALLDQRLHSVLATQKNFDAQNVLQTLHREHGLTCRTDPVFSWHIGFTHLVGYGATYYSYAFDKVLAERIYKTTFAVDPLSREAGENFKQNLLRHGGSRDPWQCISDVLNDPTLSTGDASAMARVGQWSLGQ